MLNVMSSKTKNMYCFVIFIVRSTAQYHHSPSTRGRQFDSGGGGGGGGGWHFLDINFLTLKMLKINTLSYSGKKINNLTLKLDLYDKSNLQIN